MKGPRECVYSTTAIHYIKQQKKCQANVFGDTACFSSSPEIVFFSPEEPFELPERSELLLISEFLLRSDCWLLWLPRPVSVDVNPTQILSWVTLNNGRIFERQAAVIPTAGSMHVHTELWTSLSMNQISHRLLCINQRRRAMERTGSISTTLRQINQRHKPHNIEHKRQYTHHKDTRQQTFLRFRDGQSPKHLHRRDQDNCISQNVRNLQPVVEFRQI